MVEQQLIISLPDETSTRQLGFAFGRQLPAGTIVLLQGDLGSGKTTFVQGIGQGLGLTDPIVSPTFILLNEYLEGRIPLYHFDLYRLDPVEVNALQLDTYWEGMEYPLGLVAIEWAERLPDRPSSYLQVTLSHTLEGSRQAEIIAVGGALDSFQPIWDDLKRIAC